MSGAGSSMIVDYAPGGWVGMAGPDIWLLAETDPHGEMGRRCWELVRDGADEDAVLAAITRRGFRTIRSFALVRRIGEAAHAVVRGIAHVELVTREAGTVHITPTGADDWADRLVSGTMTTIRLLAGDSRDESARLPLTTGVVLASALEASVEAPGADPLRSASPDADALRPAASDVRPATVEHRSRAAEPADPVDDGVPRYVHMLGLSDPPTTASTSAMPATLMTVESQWPPIDQPTSDQPTSDQPTSDQPAPERSARLYEPIGPGFGATLPPPAEDDGLIRSFLFAPLAAEPPAGQPVGRAPEPAVVDGRPEQTQNNDEDDISVTTIRRRNPDAIAAMAAGPTVLAVSCVAGHVNPVTAPSCRLCRAAIHDRTARSIPRPPLGELRLSTGDTIQLERGVILGRAPDAPAGGGRDVPNIMRLRSPDGDISRNHVEVRLDGWRVLVVDLGSTNGTFVAQPGGAYARIEPHDETEIQPGAVVSLSETTTFRFEVTG